MAPNGLGLLLGAGYIADASVFYCPSSDNMPGLENGGSAVTENPDKTRYGGYRLSHWKNAGGLDASAMQYGDWSEYYYSSAYNWVLSHYAYRNAPVNVTYPWHYYQQGSAYTGIAGTKPNVYMRIGQPMFRTNKELNGRVLVVDAFGKGMSYDAEGKKCGDSVSLRGVSVGQSKPGCGIKAHRTAYNTLFGDGHVKVYGDPQERLIWHAQAIPYGSGFATTFNSHRNNLASNGWFGTSSYTPIAAFTDNNVDDDSFKYHSLRVWHDFDAWGGVDVPGQ